MEEMNPFILYEDVHIDSILVVRVIADFREAGGNAKSANSKTGDLVPL